MLPLIAGCAEQLMAMETDVSEANRYEICPADVSEASRGLSGLQLTQDGGA